MRNLWICWLPSSPPGPSIQRHLADRHSALAVSTAMHILCIWTVCCQLCWRFLFRSRKRSQKQEWTCFDPVLFMWSCAFSVILCFFCYIPSDSSPRFQVIIDFVAWNAPSGFIMLGIKTRQHMINTVHCSVKTCFTNFGWTTKHPGCIGKILFITGSKYRFRRCRHLISSPVTCCHKCYVLSSCLELDVQKLDRSLGKKCCRGEYRVCFHSKILHKKN